MNSKRLSIFIVLLSMALSLWAQSLTVTQDVKLVPNSSVLALYKNQFGKWEKPDLDDTFPYVVIRIALEGNAREVKAAKKMVGLYLGTQTAVEAVWKDNENELLFLIPSRVRHVEITCGDGCDKQTIIDAMQLRSNMVYSGKVHYVPAEEVGSPSIYKSTRQFFTFSVTPTNASVRVMVNGAWQYWPVEEGRATKTLNYGKYKYEIAAENYTTKTGEIVVSDKSRELNVALTPNFGWLHITGENLEGAYVFATNTQTSVTQQLGQLPFDAAPRMDGGSYQIEIQKKKYKPFSNFVNIIPGDTVKMYPVLEANYGEVKLTVDGDPEAEIYVDGELLGKGEWIGTLEQGQYSVESRRAYHHSAYTNVDVLLGVSNQNFTLNPPLPLYGALVIEGTPGVADVYLDDQLMGKTPFIINQVLAGPHNLRVEKKGYIPYTTEITIEENGEQTVSYEMKRGSLPKTPKTEIAKQPIVTQTSVMVAQGDSALQALPTTDTVAVAPAKRKILNTLLMYEAGYSFASNADSLTQKLTHGAMLAQVYNGVGWYLKGRSNFDFSKPDYDFAAVNGGYVGSVLPYYSGKTKTSEWMLAGGLMFDFTSMGKNPKKKRDYNTFGIYLGAGYGKRDMLWETTNGTWIYYEPNSYKGICADAGVIFSIFRLTLSCGVTTIGFKNMDMHVGVGLTL